MLNINYLQVGDMIHTRDHQTTYFLESGEFPGVVQRS